jgi:uncharacterized protein
MPTIVGLISDTHGQLRASAMHALEGVELILHAGDVGNRDVMIELNVIAPVQAVYGNVDDPHTPDLEAHRWLAVEGWQIHVSHGHELGRPTPELALARYAGDVVVFGHTHKAIVVRGRDGRLAINPGAAGPRRFNLLPRVARLTITAAAGGAAAETSVEIIPLA